MISKKNNNELLCMICSLLVLYTPQFANYVDLLLEQALTFGVTVILFFYLVYSKKTIPVCALFCALSFLNIFCIDLVRSYEIVITNDFFELIKPFSFLLYFALGYTVHFSSQETSKYAKWLMGNFLLISLLSILEAIVPSVNNLFAIIYKSPRAALKMKAVFSFISPYCLAAILVLPFLYFFFCFFAFKKAKYLAASLILLLALLLTQSKTVFLGVILTFGIFFFIVIFTKWIIGRRQMLLTFFVLVATVLLSFPLLLVIAKEKLSYLYAGLEIFFKAFSNLDIIEVLNAQPTTRLRFEQLQFAIAHQNFIPLIGVAIGKGVLMPESFYALYLYRTGLIGIAIHVFMVFFAGKRAFLLSKFYALQSQKKLSCFYLALFMFFISLIFSYFSSAVTDQTRIAFFFYFFIGHLYSVSLEKISFFSKPYKKNYFVEQPK